MYPRVKVKVREDEEDADQYALELSSLQSLKGFENLSPYDSSPDESPTSIVRIPSSFITSSPTSEVHVPKVALPTINEKQIVPEESKTNVRAGLISRPRATLSSPDNDAIIGSKNKTREEIVLGIKTHNPSQHGHSRLKVTTRPVVTKGPMNPRRESKGAGDSKNDVQTKGRSIVVDPSKRVIHRKVKPESVQSKTSSVGKMNK